MYICICVCICMYVCVWGVFMSVLYVVPVMVGNKQLDK